MNKSYFIVPAILLAIFGFLYNGALTEMKTKEDARIAKIEKETKEKEDAKKIVEEKAQAEARERQIKREAEDAAKAAKKEKDYADAMAKLKDEADDYAGQTAKLTKESADLDATILQTRTDKERLTREGLELAKQVELAKINRRNSELEIQRMIDMVAKKLNDSSIAVAPPPPPLPTK